MARDRATASQRDQLDTAVLNTVVAHPGLGIKELFDKLPKGVCATTDALRHRINRLYKQSLITRHGKRNSYTWTAAGRSLADAPEPEPPSPSSAEAIIDSISDGPAEEMPDPVLRELDAMREIHKVMVKLPDNNTRARVLDWVASQYDIKD